MPGCGVDHAGSMSSRELLAAGDPRLAPESNVQVAVDQLWSADLSNDRADARQEVLAFLAEHLDAADRSCPEAHLTGSALVVDDAGERTLLMLHRKLGRWFQPGGHADGNTNLAAVAWREATEETGIAGLRVLVPAIDVDVHRVAPPGESEHLHLDLRFLVMAPVGAVEAANHESLALRWMAEADLDDLVPSVDASTRRLVAQGLALARVMARDRSEAVRHP